MYAFGHDHVRILLEKKLCLIIKMELFQIFLQLLFQEEFPFMSARDNNFVSTRISIYVIRGISVTCLNKTYVTSNSILRNADYIHVLSLGRRCHIPK